MAKKKRVSKKTSGSGTASRKKTSKKRVANKSTPRSSLRTSASGRPAKKKAAARASSTAAKSKDVALVGLGASAGGLDAFKRFFSVMPSDSGMAFVLIQHLDPTHESLMVDLLARHTNMTVEQVEDRMPVEPNHVYMIPPNRYLAVSRGELHLTEPIERRGMRMSIDFFFQSLAEDQEGRAICIILSGTGTDGTLGMKSIKTHGGMVMVQDPATAQYDGMPRSAMATGMVDYVLPIEDMPDALIKYVQHPYMNHESGRLVDRAPDHLNMILALLRARTNYDFRCYKKATLNRRIQRRMGLNNIEQVSDYLTYLRDNPSEATQLFKDLLISVTSFFREPEAWDLLQTEMLPDIVSRTLSAAELDAGEFDDRPVRVWVPGCATGEEAYSVAMLLMEQLPSSSAGMQIFATDIDEDALEVARTGVYPDSIAADVSPERLRKFFVKTAHSFQVNKSLRESVTFAVQNLISDPPFSRLDLICCRNLLIYLESEIQRKVINLFHFALNEDGYIFLGNSETIGTADDLFKVASKQWRIYRRIRASHAGRVDFPIATGHERPTQPPAEPDSALHRPVNLGQLAQHMLLSNYAPPSVLITGKGEILFYFGDTTGFLTHPTGQASHDVMEMAREGLKTKLRAAIHNARQKHEMIEMIGARVRRSGQYCSATLRVAPVDRAHSNDGLLLVSFLETPDQPRLGDATDADVVEDSALRQLELELNSTREDLQSTIEELETSNEELKASNEEVMSMNEELQSTNEELETSKEELQSLNEELNTVNNQLQDKVAELEGTNNDLNNLLTSTELATVFLDTDLCIKRYTPAATGLLNLIPGDVGRPISDISTQCDDPDLLADARLVLDRLTPVEKEIRSDGNCWYIRRILPYRTHDNKIDGVVVIYSNVTELEQAQQELRVSHERYRRLVGVMPAAMYICDVEGRITLFNDHACKLWGKTPEIGDEDERFCGSFRMLLRDDTELPHADCPMAVALRDGTSFRNEEITIERPDGTRIDVVVNIDPIYDADGKQVGAINVFNDITQLKRAEAERAVLQVTTDERQRMGQDLHDTTSQELTGLGFMAQSLIEKLDEQLASGPPRRTNPDADASSSPDLLIDAQKIARKMEEGVQRALDQVRRFAQGLLPVEVDVEGLMAALRELVARTSAHHEIQCTFDCDQPVNLDDNATATQLYLIAKEAVANAVKHADANHVRVQLSRDHGLVVLLVRDDGTGIDGATQQDGMGMHIMRHRASLIHANLNIEPADKGGTLVRCVFNGE